MADARVQDVANPLMFQDVVIPAGATGQSGAVYLNGMVPVRINMPAAWATANLTVLVSTDGATYNPLYDQYGTEYTITAAAARAILLAPADFVSVQYIKFRSGTAATPVNQTTSRTLVLSLRAI